MVEFVDSLLVPDAPKRPEARATVMVYPATWKTLPITIFGLSDRGQVFSAAACTSVLLAATPIALALLTRIRTRALTR